MPEILFILAIAVYLLAMNLLAFVLMASDKKKAKSGAWRVPEKVLFLSAILGGSIGAIVGMQVFRHKTKHWYFKYGMPAILIIQVVLAAFLWYYFSNH
ncbi:MAG: DUF1294 domain-containing protein [Acetatifactor sp.]|nr:DUF1294 domain-containing protein [Acetatifactor sp.]